MSTPKNLLLTIFFLLCVNTYAQTFKTPLPDSLQHSIDTATSPRSKLEGLLVAGDYFYGLYTTDGYNMATTYYNKALEQSISDKDKEYETYAHKALGSVYDALGDEYLPKALEHYQKSVNIAETELKKDTALFIGVSLLVAHTYHKLKDKTDCKKTIDGILSYLGTNEKYKRSRKRVSLLAAYFMGKLGDYAASKKYFDNTGSDTSYFPNRGIWNMPKYYHQVQVYLAAYRNDYTNAYNFGKETLRYAANKSDSMELFQQLSVFAQKLQLYQEAFEYKKIETDLYREIVKAESFKNVDNNLLKTELFLKEENTKLLEKQKKSQQQFNTWLLIGLGIAGLFAGILLWFAAQRRKQNRLLQQQNEEKAILLGEIHHRVKNNLEMLQSMLLLQIREYKNDNNVLQALSEASNRIQSIALLHKQLYNGNFAHTDAHIYFNEMFERILGDVNTRQHKAVGKVLSVDPVQMLPDHILPLALLINEWITNSVKYAFGKDQQNPSISLYIKQQGTGLTINYTDNGENTGAAELSGTGFGSRLINSLVKQLNGQLSVNKSQLGWQYILNIPIN